MRPLRLLGNAAQSEIVHYKVARDRLLQEIPDLDEVTLTDTLEGISDIREILAELLRSALEDELMSAALSTRISEMKGRLRRLDDQAEKKRAFVLRAMAEAEIKTLTEPDFTASLRWGSPTLEVLSEERIPPAYWKPQPPKLDRQGLLAALKSGGAVEGVAIAPPALQLSVRTK